MKLSKGIQFFFSILILGFIAFAITFFMYKTNSYPQGNDIYGHLFKIETLYNSMREGNFYPLFTKNWYSGIELFRYWPPMSYYFYCLFMFLTDGNLYISFVLFTFSVYFVGGFGFLLFGLREDRIPLCTAIAVVFFLIPDNMRVFYGEGNIPRIFITMLLPYFFFFFSEFLVHKRRYAIIAVTIMTVFIVFSHIMISAMLGISAFLYISLYCFLNKEFKHGIVLLIDLVASYLTAGIILIPGLIGGVVTQNSSASQETSSSWSQWAYISLNPVIHFKDLQIFYLGISIFLIMVLGILTFRKETLPGFLSAIIIYFGTTMIVLPILSTLPMSQVFWMIRFIPMAEVMFFMAIIYWENLKRSVLIFFLAVIFIDSFFSLKFIWTKLPPIAVQEANLEERFLLNEAIENTTNRLSIMDLSNIGSYPSYAIIKNNADTNYLFGWAYQGAPTIKEIVNLNEAFEKRFFPYVFDRLINYGCDTVIIKKDEVPREYERMLETGKHYGYRVIDETSEALLLKYDIDYQYGSILHYDNACIGASTEYLSFLYPSFLKLKDDYLDSYTFEELCKYKKIYISGPSYHPENKEYCEDLLQKLSDNGTKIYIDMNNLQDDLSAGRNSILGVYAQTITFTDRFPVIELNNGSQFRLKIDTSKYSEWRTVYFSNLKKVIRKSEYSDGKYLDYLGSSPNENIIFIGLNLVYYCAENQLESTMLYEFLDEIFEESRIDTNEKELVPIDISYNGNDIVVNSDYDNVDINISNIDSYESDKYLGKETFVRVNKGTTNIEVTYPHFRICVVVTLFGIMMNCFIFIYVYSKDFFLSKELED